MPGEITVPSLGESVLEATVGRWLKQEGESIAVGDPLVELETDKVNQELEAQDAGVLERILRREGETVKVGDSLAVIGKAEGASKAEGGRRKAEGEGPERQTPNAEVPTPNTQHPTPSTDADEVRASPLAQRLADELDVDLSNVPPSGPGGRVTRQDVQRHAQRDQPPGAPAPAGSQPSNLPTSQPSNAQPAAPPNHPTTQSPNHSDRPETRQRLSRRRLTIARRLVEAQQTAAMLTTFNEVDMSTVMTVRKRRREEFEKRYGVGLGYMSFFTKAAVGALKAFPQVNGELQGEELVLKQYYDIGIAIGAPEGLVVPVVRNADRLSFADIERAIRDFAQKAKDGTLTLDDLRGGTFTITNGGVFGSLLSTPILNPPQVAILGMHKIQDRPVVVDGQVAVRPMMYLALSYDHRIVDGREAVQFLVRIKELIEDPERLLLEG